MIDFGRVPAAIGDGPHPAGSSRLVACAVMIGLAAYAVAVALWLYPHDCDAAFVMHDAIWYGDQAERTPRASVNPNHPLFHLLTWALVDPLRTAGISEPGHVACRIVAGLGGAWLLLQIAGLAGRRRVLIGAAFAGVVGLSRGFIVDTAVGENVVPAAAAGLFALTCAIAPAPRLVLPTAALVVALLFRQDNLLLVPGIAAAIASGAPPGRRVRNAALVVVLAGVATVALYGLVWFMVARHHDFAGWLLGIGRAGAFAETTGPAVSRLGIYVAGIATVLTGHLGPPEPLALVPAGVSVLVLAVATIALRGTSPRPRIWLVIVPTLVCRALFHAWFEANNFEWLILPVALLVAVGASIAHGDPRTPIQFRRVGVLMLVSLAAWSLFAHARSTWALRDRSFARVIDDALDVERGGVEFMTVGVRAD